MSKKKKLLGFIIGCMFILTPAVSFNIAYSAGLVPDCGKVVKVQKLDDKGQPVIDTKTKEPVMESTVAKPCDFNSLMDLINNVINFLLFDLATPLVAVILVYAGFKLITSGGSSESLTKAKKMILNAIFGYIIALAAWLIIKTILTTVGFNPKDAFLIEF